RFPDMPAVAAKGDVLGGAVSAFPEAGDAAPGVSNDLSRFVLADDLPPAGERRRPGPAEVLEVDSESIERGLVVPAQPLVLPPRDRVPPERLMAGDPIVIAAFKHPVHPSPTAELCHAAHDDVRKIRGGFRVRKTVKNRP